MIAAPLYRARSGRGAKWGAACQRAVVPNRDGGLRGRASSQSKAHFARARCSVDAGKVRAALFKGREERLSRCGGDCRGVQRPTIKFVATKTADQLDLQALHRVRERLVSQRTGIINQIRAFLLERGIAVRQGLRALRAELPPILATPPDVLSPRMVRIVEDLSGDW